MNGWFGPQFTHTRLLRVPHVQRAAFRYAASQHSGQVYRGTAPSDPDGFCALKSASPRPLTACSQPTTAMVLEDRFHRDRKRVVEGKSVSERVDIGGRRNI